MSSIPPAATWHVSYTEPHPTRGTWTSPPKRFAIRDEAERYRSAVSLLSGADAPRRRTWTITEVTS